MGFVYLAVFVQHDVNLCGCQKWFGSMCVYAHIARTKITTVRPCSQHDGTTVLIALYAEAVGVTLNVIRRNLRTKTTNTTDLITSSEKKLSVITEGLMEN